MNDGVRVAQRVAQHAGVEDVALDELVPAAGREVDQRALTARREVIEHAYRSSGEPGRRAAQHLRAEVAEPARHEDGALAHDSWGVR